MIDALRNLTDGPHVPKNGSTINLHTMVGHKHTELAALCLGSMVKFYDQPIHVILHEDGSVTQDDMALFRATVPNSTFVMKCDADGPVNEFLARYPACRRLRDKLVYGLKIFDIQILEQGPELSYTDCDIVFLRPLTKLFALPSNQKVGGVFMKDPIQAYCLTPFQLLQNRKLHLANRLNGGFLHFKRSAFDWDLAEWFLTHDEYVVRPYWKEQTAWSVLAAAAGSYAWDENYVRVINKREDLDSDVAVAHFVSRYRFNMKYLPKEGEGHTVREPPVQIAVEPFGECSGSRFFIDEAGRLANAVRRKVSA
jgi:hypothetical protein